MRKGRVFSNKNSADRLNQYRLPMSKLPVLMLELPVHVNAFAKISLKI